MFGNKKPLDNQDNVDNNGLPLIGGGHNGDHITTGNDEPEVSHLLQHQEQPQTFFRGNENLETTNNGAAAVAGQVVHEGADHGQKVVHLDIAVEGELDDEEVKFVFFIFILFLFLKKLFFAGSIFIYLFFVDIICRFKSHW